MKIEFHPTCKECIKEALVYLIEQLNHCYYNYGEKRFEFNFAHGKVDVVNYCSNCGAEIEIRAKD